MANIIIPDSGRRESVERIMKQYGVNRADPAMRDAAETSAARTQEAIEMSKAEAQRRFY